MVQCTHPERDRGSDHSLQSTIAVLSGCTGRREIKMNEMEKRKKLVDYINSRNTDEIVALHNDYCAAAGYDNDHIYSMDELDDFFSCSKPHWILERAFYGKFNPRHEYFRFNNSYNLESADYIFEMPISVDEIADYILSEEDSLGNDEIKEILDGGAIK